MSESETRALATIEEVVEVENHPNADRLDLVKVRGWRCITGRDSYKPGDKVIYFEIDSALPLSDDRFAEFGERKTRTMEVKGVSRQVHPLKTIRLRGEVSQGLVLPLSSFPEVSHKSPGDDVTAALNVVKYESRSARPGPPRRGSLSIAYPRPKFVPMTDAERVQNIPESSLRDVWDGDEAELWVASEKIHGTSTSIFVDYVNGFMGVTSRNLMLLSVDSDGRSHIAEELHPKMFQEWPDAKCVVIQGELAGPGLLANTLDLPDKKFFAFRVMVDMEDVPQSDWPEWLNSVPVLDVPFPRSVDEAIKAADSLDSLVSPGNQPEGIVWRRERGGKASGRLPRCVKAISPGFLLASGD